MAKNVTTSSITNYTGIRVVFSQIGQSIANNTSTLRASVYQRTTGYTSSWQSGSTVNITVDGQTKGVWVPPWNVSGQSEWHLGNVDFTVSHNSAGGKSAGVSHSWSHINYGQSASSTFYFDTIPRASSIGGINQTQIGTSMTVGISRKSGSFTHQVWYRLPGQSWINLGTGFTTSATFTIPLSQLTYLPNSASGALEVSIQTKNGSTNIGSEVRKKFTVYVPSSVIPSLSSIKIEEGASSVIDYDDYIQNTSKLKISLLGANGIYGSTIKAYKIEVDNQILNAQSGITQPIRKSGRIPVKGTVTDSRNRTFFITEYVVITPYELPRFRNETPRINRAKQNGVIDPLGRYMRIDLDSVISSLFSNNQRADTPIYEMGSISVSTGNNLTSNNRMRSSFIPVYGTKMKIIKSSYLYNGDMLKYFIRYYDKNKNYISGEGFFEEHSRVFDLPPNTVFVRIGLAFIDERVFDERDIDDRVLSIFFEGEHNSTTIRVRSKKITDTQFTEKKVINSALTYKGTEIIGLYDLDYSYNVQILLQDKFNTTLVVAVIAEGKVAMQIMNETVAIGFITTEVKRNLYVGEKGMQNLGPYYDKDGNELGGVLPSLTVSVDSRYTETPSATWTTLPLKNMSNIVASTDNYSDYYSVTSNGIRVLKSGWYLVSANMNYVPSANIKQMDLYVLKNGKTAEVQNVYESGYSGYFANTQLPQQVIYLDSNDLIQCGYNIGSKIEVTIYEKSKLSLTKIG